MNDGNMHNLLWSTVARRRFSIDIRKFINPPHPALSLRGERFTIFDILHPPGERGVKLIADN